MSINDDSDEATPEDDTAEPSELDNGADAHSPDTEKAEPFSLGLDAELVTPLIVAGSAIAAALGGFSPTGNAGADFVLSAGFGAVFPWLADRVTGRSVLYAGLAALICSGLQLPALPLAVVAVSLLLAPAMIRPFDEPTRHVARTLAAALITQSALHFPNIEWVGTASLLATVALAPIVYSAWQRADREERLLVRRAATAAAGFVVVATVLAGAAALLARGSVEDGIAQAETGVDAIEAGDQDGAAELLGAAGEDFRSAVSLLGGPLSWPARLVPVVAQHSRALETAAREGQELSAAAVQTVTTADVDQIRGSNGAIDLDLVRDVNRQLGQANLVLRESRAAIRSVRTPWLLPLLDDRLESVEVELVEVLADIDLADHATAVIPGILGGDGPRQYLVLFVQPAEAREYGGFVGAYGLLRADDGQLSLVESGSIFPDFGEGRAEFTDPSAFPEAYFDKQPAVFPQNLTGIADLSTIYRAARDLAPQWREDPDFVLDGLMTIDPYALAGFLELTGPITIEGRAEPITSENVASYLLREQYLEFEEAGRDVRQDALRELAAGAFGELLSIEIPGPERLGAIFGPVARSNRLAFTTRNEDENALLSRVLLDADLPIVGELTEMIGVYGATAVAGKLDAYSTRNLTYEVVVDPESGRTEGTLTLEVTNDAPPDAPEFVLNDQPQDGYDGEPLELGNNLAVINLYTRSTLGGFSSSDPDFLTDEATTSLSYDHHMLGFEVPIGGRATVQTDLTGRSGPGRYDLLVTAQPTAVIGTATIVVRPAAGWRVVEGPGTRPDGSWSSTTPLDFHQAYSLLFERAE